MGLPLERLKEKVQRENLWIFVLSILSKNDRRGYEIRLLVKNQFGFLSGNVTAYKVLYTLKNQGYVKNQGKIYSITEKGRQEIKLAKAFLNEIEKSI